MGDLLAQLIKSLDRKTAGTAAVVVLVSLLLLAIVGHIGRASFTRYILNDTFGLSDTIDADLANAVPSGYSRTFVFTNDAGQITLDDRNQSLNFYALPNQYIYVLARGSYRSPSGQAYPPTPIPFNITLDNSKSYDLEVPINLPYESQSSIKGESLPGYVKGEEGFNIHNMHVLNLRPTSTQFNGTIVIDMVVLVANSEVRAL